jgi:hypothetical protein
LKTRIGASGLTDGLGRVAPSAPKLFKANIMLLSGNFRANYSGMKRGEYTRDNDQ